MNTPLSENLIVNALLPDSREVIGSVGRIEGHMVEIFYACGDRAGWTPKIMIDEATPEQSILFHKERQELGLLPIDQM